MLFLIYINDIVNVSKRCNYIIFADDTTLLFTNKSIQSLNSKLKHDLENIKQCITHNKLNLNISKTNLVFFGNS